MKKFLLALIVFFISGNIQNTWGLSNDILTEKVEQQTTYKVYVTNNYFYLEINGTLTSAHKKDVEIHKYSTTSTKYRFIFKTQQGSTTELIEFSALRDKDNNAFVDQPTFENWYTLNTGFNISQARERIYVTQDNYLTVLANIDSSKEYFLDGVIDIGSYQITVPVGGITLTGFSFDISGLVSSADNYVMFISESEIIGSGNFLGTNYFIRVSGINSKVHNLYDSDGTHAIEYNKVNFINCSSLGDLHSYRQYLENGTGRFGGQSELTFNGTMNGARISTSISRGTASNTALFRAGASLTFSGRFITDINADLNTTGALFDFSESNFINDESLIIKGAFVSRNGLINTSDVNIHPNIDETSVKSLWSDNTGIPNTNKYIKASITTEVLTTVVTIDIYYVLNGTYTVNDNSHFDMPLNGQLRLLSGNGNYQVTGYFVLDSTQNNVVDIRVTKSIDDGSTFPIEVNHIKGVINALTGSRDVGFFPINFIVNLKKGDRLRIEVENKTGANDITGELDSYFIISQL